MLKIDSKRPLPIFMQVEEWLEERITVGKYRAGEKIPSESKLANILNVSRPTIKRAVFSLVDKGILICRPCIGSFVKKKPPLKSTLSTIGLILPNISDPFLYQLTRELEKILQEVGYSLILGDTQNNPEKEAGHIKNFFYLEQVKGFLICSASRKRNSIFKESLKVPVVFIGLKPNGIKADFVSIDNYYAVNQVINYFISLGHKKIGYIRGKIYPEIDIRREAYEKALEYYGLKSNPEWISESELPDEEGGQEAMEKLLERSDRPTAVFAESDTAAIGAMKVMKEKGLKIPDDISIAGFDNIHASAHLEVPLTTIDYPVEKITKKSVEILMKKISNPEISHSIEKIILRPKLIIRSSCGKLS